MEERLVYLATKRLLPLLLPAAVYTFNRYFLKGFDAQRGYLSHSISIDEYFELAEWFPDKSFGVAQLADRLGRQEKKVSTSKIKNNRKNGSTPPTAK